MTSSLKRQISLPAAIFIIIGYVVGATIFILPGELAAVTGPTVFLAYLFAAIPAIFYGFVIAQVGGAYPISGGCYVVIKEVLSPFLAFVYLWVILSLAVVAVPLIAFGFSRYLGVLFPMLDERWAAVGVVLVFIAANSVGTAIAGIFQNIMVVLFLVALLLFVGAGLTNGQAELLLPLFPFGLEGVLLATITASFSYAGVLVVAEIAGEVKDPGRNIPLAILIAFVVIVALYSLVPLALTMLTPWQDLARSQTSIVNAVQDFLPAILVHFIWGGALFAAATSVNSIQLGLSRDLLQGAQDGVFPEALARLSSKTGTPVAAVLLVGSLSVVGILLGGDILQYAGVAIVGLMVSQILTSLAVVWLPKKKPETYRGALFKLSPKVLYFFAATSVVFSIGFLVVLAVQSPLWLGILLVYVLFGTAYYFWSKLRGGKRVK